MQAFKNSLLNSGILNATGSTQSLSKESKLYKLTMKVY